MIHPQYWSLATIYVSLKRKYVRYRTMVGSDSIMTINDIECYSKMLVKGKAVLDVGAYNGDSAKLFLNHGAKEVVCIECDKEYADKISLPNTRVINEAFKLEHLLIPHDFMKMDIEGWEALLLDYKGILKPTIIEVHSGYLCQRFKELGFRVIGEETRSFEKQIGECIMTNVEDEAEKAFKEGQE